MKYVHANVWFVPVLTLLAGLIVGCSTTKDNALTPAEKLVKRSTACAILESGNWHAWLDTYQQEKGSYRLNISGQVRLANPGYDLEWVVGPADRMNPPGLNLYLTAQPQEGMHAQVITDLDVSYEMHTAVSKFRHVSIVCGDKLLGQLIDVELTD